MRAMADPKPTASASSPDATATASGAPATVTTKSVEHGEASRLPDTSWLWRRVLIFAVLTVMCVIAARVSERVSDIGTLRQINRYSYGIILLGLLLYGVGATITDVVKLMTAFASTKKITETKADAGQEKTP